MQLRSGTATNYRGHMVARATIYTSLNSKSKNIQKCGKISCDGHDWSATTWMVTFRMHKLSTAYQSDSPWDPAIFVATWGPLKGCLEGSVHSTDLGDTAELPGPWWIYHTFMARAARSVEKWDEITAVTSGLYMAIWCYISYDINISWIFVMKWCHIHK